MSDFAREARRQMREKVREYTKKSAGVVDASTYGPEETDMKADVQTGARPISRRQFKRGGKVIGKAEGMAPKANAGRKQRKSGGALTADSLINRNVREANEKREGEKHIGAFKKGGAVKRAAGGNVDMGGKNFGVKGGWEDAPKKPSVPAELPIPKGGYDEPAEKTPPKAGREPIVPGRKYNKGGKVHSDEKEDRSLVKKMVKKGALTGKAGGGLVDVKDLPKTGILGLSGLAGIDPTVGLIGKKRGGSIDDITFHGDLPSGGRKPRKDGGEAQGPGRPRYEVETTYPRSGKKVTSDYRYKERKSAEDFKNFIETPRKAGRTRPSVKINAVEGERPEAIPSFMAKPRKDGGRLARKSGGKTDVNIIIAAGPKGGQGMQPPLGAAPVGPNGIICGAPAGAVPVPVGAPAAGGAPMGGMPQGAPQGAPAMPQMARKRGGRTEYKMTAGAGTGKGRLEKIDWYGDK